MEQRSRAWFAVDTILFLCGMGLAIFMWTNLRTVTRGINYQFNDKETHITEFLPIRTISNGDHLYIDGTLILNPLHAGKWSVEADDCIEQITINGKEMLTEPLPCNWNEWHTLDLSGILHAGENTFYVIVKDSGGKAGFGMMPSWQDPLVWLMLCVFLLNMSYFGVRLLSFIGAKKSYQGLFLILLLALAVRLALVWHPGHTSDLGINQGWAKSATELGFGRSYWEQADGNMLPNYPPLSILVFGATGHIYKFLMPHSYQASVFGFVVAIKLPAILFDILTCTILFFLFKKIQSEKAGVIAALIYALHPAVIYESAVWGQVDTMYALALFCAVCALHAQKWFWAGVLLAMSLLLKMQAVIVLPVFLILLFARKEGIGHVLLGIASMIMLVLLPFIKGGALGSIANVYAGSLGYYKNLSLGAYNFWWSLYADASGKEDTLLLFNVIPFRTVGLLLFGTCTLAILLSARTTLLKKWKDPLKVLPLTLITSGLISTAFFLFNTEMHERYLFPSMLLLLPLIFTGPVGIALYAGTSVLFWWNLMGVVTFSSLDKALFNEFPTLDVFIASLQVGIFVATCIYVHTLHAQLRLKTQGHWTAEWNALRTMVKNEAKQWQADFQKITLKVKKIWQKMLHR